MRITLIAFIISSFYIFIQLTTLLISLPPVQATTTIIILHHHGWFSVCKA